MKTLKLSEIDPTLQTKESISYFLGNFLDSFYCNPSVDLLIEPPALMRNYLSEGIIWDAYWGGIVESLSRKYHFQIPLWVEAPERFLKKPFFGIQAPSFRATLLLESPIEFRRRNLFVTANALERV